MRWFHIVIALAGCEHSTKKPPEPPPELGGMRGLVTGGGYSPIEREDGRSAWIEKGPLADMSIAIGTAVVKTDAHGRYERLLPAGKYLVRIDLQACHLPDGPDAGVVIDVEPGRYSDASFRCQLAFK